MTRIRRVQLIACSVVTLVCTIAGAADLGKAREEGPLVLYTSFTQADIAKLVDPFSKKYPGIRTDVIRGVASSMIPRITTEAKAGKSGDVVFTKAEYLDLLKSQALLQSYRSPQERLPGDAYVTGVWMNLRGIAYNSRRVRPAQVPKQYTDLLDPQWKGRTSSI